MNFNKKKNVNEITVYGHQTVSPEKVEFFIEETKVKPKRKWLKILRDFAKSASIAIHR